MTDNSKVKLIGIAQGVITKEPGVTLVAPNLGSCLGISAYDSASGWGGMIHCLLPLSKSDPAKAAASPCMYVDTGFTHLLSELIRHGVRKETLIICVVGGASINDRENFFEIGKRNHTILKKLMWKNNLLLKAEEVGESISRTLSLSIDTGGVTLKTGAGIRELC